MAEVSFLHFPEEDHDLFVDNDLLLDEISTLDSFPYWSQIADSDSLSPRRHDDEIFAPNSSINITRTPNGSNFAADTIEDRNNQVNFVMDLFHQRVEQSQVVGGCEFMSETVNDLNFGVIEDNYDVGVNSLDLDLRLERLGLGLGLEDDDRDGFRCGAFMLSDYRDEFYVARRESGNGSRDENEIKNEISCSSSRVSGLMVVGIDSDDDEEEEGNGMFRFHVHSEEEDFVVDNLNDDDDDLSIPLQWDSFQLEDDLGGVNNDLEWEEVDDRVDEREVLSVVADHDEDGSISVLPISEPEEENEVEERGRGLGNVAWEVLLNVNNLGRNPEMMANDDDDDDIGPYFGDNDDLLNAAEYELTFGQFAESENASLNRPPASKVVVEKLPSVITTKEDVVNEKALCAVCKDQIEIGEDGKQLPCLHRYHGDCILPWLGIRNTCPLCRYELPTDDPDYEQRRIRTAARIL